MRLIDKDSITVDTGSTADWTSVATVNDTARSSKWITTAGSYNSTANNITNISNHIYNLGNTSNYLTNTMDFLKEALLNYCNEYEIKEVEEETNMDFFGNMFNGMFKPVARGYCKMGVNGKVAVKTSTGYKTFDIATNKLTNCDNFAFDMDGAFWVVPTFKVEKGDIILVNGKPRCVIEIGANSIKTFCYEDSTVAETIPERHVFMGKTYCYGKIFSPFMNMSKGDGMMKNMMNMMMMSQMFGGNSNGNNTMGMNPMMFMMMNNSGSNPFEGMFDGAFDFGVEEDEVKEDK